MISSVQSDLFCWLLHWRLKICFAYNFDSCLLLPASVLLACLFAHSPPPQHTKCTGFEDSVTSSCTRNLLSSSFSSQLSTALCLILFRATAYDKPAKTVTPQYNYGGLACLSSTQHAPLGRLGEKWDLGPKRCTSRKQWWYTNSWCLVSKSLSFNFRTGVLHVSHILKWL